MQIIECAKCGLEQKNKFDLCPNCGSTQKIELFDIKDIMQINEKVIFSITQQNSLWNLLPNSLRFMVDKLNDNSFQQHNIGFSIQVFICCAMIIEGLLTDCLEEELARANKNATKFDISEREIAYANWKDKKNYLARVFKVDIETLPKFDEVEIVFQIRNNIAHGRSYKVAHTTIFRSSDEQDSSEIEITNSNYANIYLKLEAAGLLPPLQQNSILNIDMLFKPSIAKHLYDSSILFLTSWMDLNEMSQFDKIQRDFREAFNIN